MSLRWYQQAAVDATWQYLCTQSGNPIIVGPTGCGKSHMIGQLARDAVRKHSGRVLVIADRKELLTQNAAKVGMDCGVYSAGLHKRDTEHDVIFAGIQSVHSRGLEFGRRDLVIVDEVHKVPVSEQGMYHSLMDDLRVANPKMRAVGLTATPYRLDCGPICRPDGLFHRVAYSVPIRDLIDEGFLCQLISRPSETDVDLSQVRLRGGEFVQGQMEEAFQRQVAAACQEIVRLCQGRHSVLVFCSGVQHAEDVAAELSRLTGEDACAVTGRTDPLFRSVSLQRFRSGELRWLTNCDVLTTGFDAPCIDAIAVLRATMSPGLFAQMVGRGFRVDKSKDDCLVLDFGGNVARHGPLDSPSYGVDRQRSPGAEPGEAPTKTCPNCQAEVLAGRRECGCGWLFPEPEPKEFVEAGEESILAEPETWDVLRVEVRPWRKKGWVEGMPQTLRVDYEVVPAGLGDSAGNLSTRQISEWVCVEHGGYAGRKAAKWWQARCAGAMPASADEAADLCDAGVVAKPCQITTIQDGRWQRIVDAVIDEIPEFVIPEWNDEEIPF